MKYPRQMSMPSGIQLWLEEQLTLRGVDAAVYSKYILSFLCNQSSDLSAQPKDSGVRTLIEELGAKLKVFQEKGQYPFSDFPSSKNIEVLPPQPAPEKAYKHTSTFSSSTKKNKTESISSSLGSSGVWSGKRAFGSSVGKNRTVSEGNNRDGKYNNRNFNCLEENKENNGCNRDAREKMRSRSTVKQTPEKAIRNMAKSLDRKDDLNWKTETTKSRRLYHQSNELPNENIKNIWATDKSFDDLSGCDQDLPMDFQQLLESPRSSKISPEFSRCIGTKQPPSFIQCGTNITSSIWSEKAEDAMDCSLTGEINSDMSLSFNASWGVPTNEAALNRSAMMQESTRFNPDLWGSKDVTFVKDHAWKAVGNMEETKEPLIDFRNWSDIESTTLLLNNPSNFFSAIGSNLHGSLNALNHNKEDSSFTEVIPKVSLGMHVSKDKMVVEPTVQQSETDASKKEEDDLLTSMKTHFRPIKQEIVEVIAFNTGTSFPDGTTFSISNSLDEPNFHRSPSGGLYLDSDVNTKYLEFNDAEDDIPSEFVPKFRVRQNEKFCQTEEIVLPPQTCYQPGPDGEEMYFPEDEKLVRSMVEEDVEEEEDHTFWRGEACIKVDGWMATWPATGIWSNEPNVQQIWCGGNVWNTASEAVAAEGGSGQYSTRLRNEWSQEAEELFSDISQHLCLNNYGSDSQPPKLVEVENRAVEPMVTGCCVSRERKRRHWSSQLGASCPPPSHGLTRSRPLTL